jgi:hypothetical protein
MVTLANRRRTGPSTVITAKNCFIAIQLLALALYGVVISKSSSFLQTTQHEDPHHDTPNNNEAPALQKGNPSTTDKAIHQPENIQVSKPIQLTTTTCESPLRGHFDHIYKAKLWGTHLRKASDYYTDSAWPIPEIRQKSASGSGSDLGDATQTSLRIIRETIQQYGVTSMIDVPCGDANWIFESYITDHLPLYIGLDVVSAVIDQNKLRFEHHVNKHFHFWDATLCPFPKFYNYSATNSKEEKSVDLIHVRDVIQHLTLKQGVAYFCNVFKSGARVLIATTFPEPTSNPDIQEGNYYRNNLSLEPFSFSEGKCEPTHPGIEPDHTCVYNLTDAKWVEEFVKSKC